MGNAPAGVHIGTVPGTVAVFCHVDPLAPTVVDLHLVAGKTHTVNIEVVVYPAAVIYMERMMLANSSQLIWISSIIIFLSSPFGKSLFPCTGTVVILPSRCFNL